MNDNIAAWDRLAIVPRMLVGGRAAAARGRDPGPDAATPDRRRTDGLPASRASRRRDWRPPARPRPPTRSCACRRSRPPRPEGLAGAVPDVARWLQLYVLKDREISWELVRRAAEAGFEAIVVTVDLPVRGTRDREDRFPVSDDETAELERAVALVADAGMTPGQRRRSDRLRADLGRHRAARLQTASCR